MSGHRRHSFQRWRVAGHAGPARRRLQCCPWHWGLACHGTGPWRCGSCPVPGTRKRCLCRDNSESQQHWTQYHADCPEAGWHSATEESGLHGQSLSFKSAIQPHEPHGFEDGTFKAGCREVRKQACWAPHGRSRLEHSIKASWKVGANGRGDQGDTFGDEWDEEHEGGKSFFCGTCPLAVRGCRSCKLFAQSMWGWLLAKFSTEIRKRTPGEFSSWIHWVVDQKRRRIRMIHVGPRRCCRWCLNVRGRLYWPKQAANKLLYNISHAAARRAAQFEVSQHSNPSWQVSKLGQHLRSTSQDQCIRQNSAVKSIEKRRARNTPRMQAAEISQTFKARALFWNRDTDNGPVHVKMGRLKEQWTKSLANWSAFMR